MSIDNNESAEDSSSSFSTLDKEVLIDSSEDEVSVNERPNNEDFESAGLSNNLILSDNGVKLTYKKRVATVIAKATELGISILDLVDT